MNRGSGKWAITLLVALSLLVGSAIGVLAEDDPIEIVASPNVLNLESFGLSVLLHTDFDFSEVMYPCKDNLELVVNENDKVEVPVDCFPDYRGDLVVKYDMEAIKGLLWEEDQEAIFDLYVMDEHGVTYYGSDTIKVISQAGESRPK